MEVVIIDESFFGLSAKEQQWFDRQFAALPSTPVKPAATSETETSSASSSEDDEVPHDMDVSEMVVLDEVSDSTETPQRRTRTASGSPRAPGAPVRRRNRGKRSTQRRRAARRLNLTLSALGGRPQPLLGLCLAAPNTAPRR